MAKLCGSCEEMQDRANQLPSVQNVSYISFKENHYQQEIKAYNSFHILLVSMENSVSVLILLGQLLSHTHVYICTCKYAMYVQLSI